MIVHQIEKLPDGYECYNPMQLCECDLRELIKLGIDECWYWYATAPYEGVGQILMRKGELYDTHDMGHCSCYGPIDRLNSLNLLPLRELGLRTSSEYYKNVEVLFNKALDLHPRFLEWRTTKVEATS